MKKMTEFKQALLLHYKGFKLLSQQAPQLFISITVSTIISAIAPYIEIYLSAQIINEIAGAKRADVLWQYVIIMMLTTILIGILNKACERWKKANSSDLLWHYDEHIYSNKFLNMDYADIENTETIDKYSLIKQNTQWRGVGLKIIPNFYENFIKAITMILGASLLTMSLFTQKIPLAVGAWKILNHPLALIVMLALLILTAILSPLYATKSLDLETKQQNLFLLGNRLYTYTSGFSNNPKRALDIRMYHQEEYIRKFNTEGLVFGTNGPLAKLARGIGGFYLALSDIIRTSFIGIAYLFVCLKAYGGAFGVGSVTQYIGAITKMSQGLTDLFQVIGHIKYNTPYLKTAFDFLEIPNAMYQGSLTTEKRRDKQYEIEFKDVSFKYPGSDTYALSHVSIKFKVGQKLAIVGMNGSGKTTFIKLLCRLYDPTEGVILLNGIDIRKYNYHDYMQIFSIVFQDFSLLAQPLGQNVASSMHYDASKVTDSLHKAGFNQLETKMPDGLDTYLYRTFTHEGIEISGGEAQKIAIARTLYKDAPFIILDEPTAALDPLAEAEIYEKFNDIIEDRTAIYISHRLSSCRFCDEIIVFDQGHPLQQGSHDTLVLDTNGKYYELWQAQAQYYH